MSEKQESWSQVIPKEQSKSFILAAMQTTARGLSDMVGRPIITAPIRMKNVPIDRLAAYAGNPGPETLGVRLLIEGELRGQALLIMPLMNALQLVDLLLEEPLGTAAQLGERERSALAEVGNVMVSYFLNAIAALTRKDILPSPPVVMVNMLGVALDAIARSVAPVSDRLKIYETAYRDAQRVVMTRFWVLPAPEAGKKAREPRSDEVHQVREKRKICLVHGRRQAREVLARALSSKLSADVVQYSCCEDVLSVSLDYDIFVVYNNFGQRKMRGVTGVRKIRALKPEAYIMGVSVKPYGEKKFLPAGADAFLLKAGNEIGEMIRLILCQDGLSSSVN